MQIDRPRTQLLEETSPTLDPALNSPHHPSLGSDSRANSLHPANGIATVVHPLHERSPLRGRHPASNRRDRDNAMPNSGIASLWALPVATHAPCRPAQSLRPTIWQLQCDPLEPQLEPEPNGTLMERRRLWKFSRWAEMLGRMIRKNCIEYLG